MIAVSPFVNCISTLRFNQIVRQDSNKIFISEDGVQSTNVHPTGKKMRKHAVGLFDMCIHFNAPMSAWNCMFRILLANINKTDQHVNSYLILQFNVSVFGFSFILFHDKARKTYQGNLQINSHLPPLTNTNTNTDKNSHLPPLRLVRPGWTRLTRGGGAVV